MSRDITDIDDPRLVKALAHPIRIRIMALLEEGTATPKQLAAELGIPLENVSYHVRTLKDFGFIKLERTRQVRGAVEHHYRAAARPRVTKGAWEQIPTVVKEALVAAALGQIGQAVQAAALEDGFARPDSRLARHALTLDEEGYREASSVLDDALERLESISAASRRRAGRGGGTKATAVTMLFDTPAAARQDGSAQRGRGRRTASPSG